MRSHRTVTLALTALLALVAAACAADPPTAGTPDPGTAVAPSPCDRDAAPPARYDHVVWIWMENHTRQQVFASPQTPYENDLARQCGSAASYASVGSPSLPNYIGAVAGDTFGIHDDRDPAAHPLTADNLFRQVRAGGGTAMSYQEAMPAACTLRSDERYAVRHNPATYFVGADDREACATDNLPLTALDLRHLPAFAFVTPDLCHDTHDCSVAEGDAWLSSWLPPLLASDDYRSGTTAVFVVWDEPTPMPLLVISPTTSPGAAPGAFDHYALLRTTEELLGLSPYLGRAADAPSMRDAFNL